MYEGKFPGVIVQGLNVELHDTGWYSADITSSNDFINPCSTHTVKLLCHKQLNRLGHKHHSSPLSLSSAAATCPGVGTTSD